MASEHCTLYRYRVREVRVVDGDTIDCVIDLGFGIGLDERVRLYGINAPETRTRDADEKQRGIRAKQRAEAFFALAEDPVLHSREFRGEARGKFGRVLGDFTVNGEPCTLAETLVHEGLAEERVY